MASGVPMSGVVEAVNDRGFKIDGQWVNRAEKFNGAEPKVGDRVSYTLYGKLVYKFMIGEGNATSRNPAAPVAGASTSDRSSPPPPIIGVGGLRGQALMAAATLMAGAWSDASPVASDVLVVARCFEEYLTGATASTEELS